MSKILNRKAYHEYHILKEYQAGIVLLGSEVKSLRSGNANIGDAFCYVWNGEVFCKNSFISKYKEASYMNHDERRVRKLLLNKKEIKDISKDASETGITLVPLEISTVNGRFKMRIAVCRGKKLYDKRESLKAKDSQREIERYYK